MPELKRYCPFRHGPSAYPPSRPRLSRDDNFYLFIARAHAARSTRNRPLMTRFSNSQRPSCLTKTS